MNILLTGSTGFIGSHLTNLLLQHHDYNLSFAVRSTTHVQSESVFVRSLDVNTDWSAALEGIDVVIHIAGTVPSKSDMVSSQLDDFRRINIDGTSSLARQAAAAGVNRFIFLSSVKVCGEFSPLNHPFEADGIPSPGDAYARSKWEAEQKLKKICNFSNMEFVIIRPPIVYGFGVKGNFSSLVNLVETGLPLPFGSIHNKRSLISVDNLINLVIKCISHPSAANQVFLASDGDDLSTTELIRAIAHAKGVPTRLTPLPQVFLKVCLNALGKRDLSLRLFSSLQVDISKTRDLLDWEPPITVQEGLCRCFEQESMS